MPIPNDMLKIVNDAIKYAQASSQLEKIYEELEKARKDI